MKMNLERGDPCFIRLHNGEVVEGTYESDDILKFNWVKYKGFSYLACGKTETDFECRFQYPLSEIKRQMRLQ